jgi:adenylate cyclase
MPEKYHLPWIRYLPAAIIFIVGVGFSVGAFIFVWHWEQRRRDYEFNRASDIIAGRLQQHADEDLEVIRTLGDFFDASGVPPEQAFGQFVHRSMKEHPTIRLLAWAPRVGDEERELFEYDNQFTRDRNFEIHQKNLAGDYIRAQPSSEYYPLHYIVPEAGNEGALGFNLTSHPLYQVALNHAAHTGEMVVTGKLEWNPDGETQQGVLAIVPVYAPVEEEPGLALGDDRHDRLQGYILGLFTLNDIFEVSGADRGVSLINLYLCDETVQTAAGTAATQPAKTLLASYETLPQLPESTATTIACPIDTVSKSEASVSTASGISLTQGVTRRQIEIANRHWSVYAIPTEEFQAKRRHWRSWATLIVGLLWTHIPVTYLLTSLSRTAQIERLARERALKAEQLRQAFRQLEAEQAKSERLLLNVLPKAIADRLKQNENTIADSFPEVTVLFADIVGFTRLASRVSPPELVKILNRIFSAFDRLASEYGLEKIKTIGDAYMVVGGLPVPRTDHAEAIARMAIAMLEEIEQFDSQDRESFSMRIGIHTGPVVAGVIGTNKFIYDLWGDTVNTASRMESHGVPGRIQVSPTTYERLRHAYDFEERGPIRIKGKGDMMVYLLSTRKNRPIPRSSAWQLSSSEASTFNSEDADDSPDAIASFRPDPI